MSVIRELLEAANFEESDSDVEKTYVALNDMATSCGMHWSTHKNFLWNQEEHLPGFVVLEVSRVRAIQISVYSNRGLARKDWNVSPDAEVPVAEVKAEIRKQIEATHQNSKAIINLADDLNSKVAEPLRFEWNLKSGDVHPGGGDTNSWRSKDRSCEFTLAVQELKSGHTGGVIKATRTQPNRSQKWEIQDVSHFDCSKILRFFNKDN